MPRPNDSGTPVNAHVTAANGINIRAAPTVTGVLVGKAAGGESVSVWLDTRVNADGYSWVWVQSPTADGWAAMGSGEDQWITPDAVAPPPVEEPPADPGLYSVAMTGDEARQTAQLFTLLAGIFADVYRRTGGDNAPG